MDERARAITPPTVDECADQVQHNSYQICLGREVSGEGAFITLHLRSHLLLLGGAGTGKTCQAAQIIDQVTRTHDCDHLQIALLDSENHVCKLFADCAHVAQIRLGESGTMRMIARSADEVAARLSNLVVLMNERYAFVPDEGARWPKILVYLEELMDVKWQLANNPNIVVQFTADLTSLAVRGSEVGIHLMVCMQAGTLQREFRETIQPLTGIALAFCVEPTMARSAGFHSESLLAENYLAHRTGQFVLESARRTVLGLAPSYDVTTKLPPFQEGE
jgi:hypothetical protein